MSETLSLREALNLRGDFGRAVLDLLASNRHPREISARIPDVKTFRKLWDLASEFGVDDNAMSIIVGCDRKRRDSLEHVPVHTVQKLLERLDARMN